MLIRWFALGLCISCAYSYPEWFKEYQKTHHKNYTREEQALAYGILLPKYKFITTHQTDLTLALHDMSDVRNTNGLTTTNTSEIKPKSGMRRRLGIPSMLDWRNHKGKSYVTPVRKQGTCGGCFAFAAIGNLEYWYMKKSNKLIQLSVQEALDCSRPDTDGCDGGLMEYVFRHAMTNPIGPESFDRYKNRNSRCLHRFFRPYIKVKSFQTESMEWNDHAENNLAYNVATYGPIPVGIDSNSYQFELYKKGILKPTDCGTTIDHAVLVVGYTPTYWIIKNSYGHKWGDNGYFYLQRGTNACGIDGYSSFVTDASI